MRTVVGTMTGTSMDGVDAVATSIEGRGLELQAKFQAIKSNSLVNYQSKLRKLARDGWTSDEIAQAAKAVGVITRDTIQDLQLNTIDLIAVHGQTIFHQPPKSVQIIDTTPICKAFDCTILTDPRQHDLRLGGEGAPITPLADWIMFRSAEQSTAIVNLGGFCNITVLPKNSTPHEIGGFDVCCCNLLLNSLAKHFFNCDYDEYGKYALKGTVNEAAKTQLFNILIAQRHELRSLGTADNLGIEVFQNFPSLSPCDALASATSAIGWCINHILQDIDRIYLAGGGAMNQSLVLSIRNDGKTDELNVPIQAREGMAMAILGTLALDGVSITLPQITGRQETKEIVGWTQVKP